MNEKEWLERQSSWLARYHPRPMLDFLRGKASERKFRLFALACCRRIWNLIPYEGLKNLVDVTERQVDGLSCDEELDEVRTEMRSLEGNPPAPVCLMDDHASLIAYNATEAVECAASPGEGYAVALCSAEWVAMTIADAVKDQNALHSEWEIHSRLLHDIFGNPFRPVSLDSSMLAWRDGIIPRLAEEAYNHRSLPTGVLETMRLGLLADALEEFGGADQDLVRHCRSEGVHVRGCWAIDLLLRKE
jgi:hypothetical protein